MGSTTWEPDEKYVYYYNSAHPTQIDSVLAFSYDEDTQQYNVMMTYRYTYNIAGRITRMIGLVTFPGFGTIEFFHLDCTYDAQNRITHYYMSLFHSQTMTLIPAGRIHFVYSGNVLQEMLSWDNLDDKLAEYSKVTFTANTNGLLVTSTEQTSADSSSWVNRTRDQYTYHAHDTSNSATYIEYLSSVLPTGTLMASFMIVGMPTQETESTWSGTAWVPSQRTTYLWDASDLLTEQLWENWSGSAWVSSERDLYQYDNNDNVSIIMEQTWAGRTWNDDYKYEYTWGSTTAIDDHVTPEVTSLQLNAYPMPFSGSITISPKSESVGSIDLSIYNLRGQEVKTFKTLPGQDVVWDGTGSDGRACASGVYFIRMTQNHKSTSTKIIKLR